MNRNQTIATETLASRGICRVELSPVEWQSYDCGDEDGPDWGARGTVRATVRFADHAMAAAVNFAVNDNGEVEFEAGSDVEVDEWEGTVEEFDARFEQIVAQATEAMDFVAEQIAAELGGHLKSEASDFLSDAADSREYSRDIYRYYGVSRRDFI